MRFLLALGIIFFLILLEFSYFFWVREYVLAYFNGSAPNWFAEFAEQFYPRLKTEKYRFVSSFFIDKADQIAFRLAFVSILGSFLLIYQKKLTLRTSFVIKNYQKYALLVYFFVANVMLALEWKEILLQYAQLGALYEPISFYSFISPIFPNVGKIELYFLFFDAIHGVGIIVSIVLLSYSFLKLPISHKIVRLVKGIQFVLLLSSAIFFIYLQGFLYGFGKIEYTYATWNWVCITLPLWLIQTWKDKPYSSQNHLLFIAVGLIYCFSGLEKIFIGGIEWLNGNALLGYLQRSRAPLGQAVANYPFIAWLFSVIVICWEVGFIMLLSSKKQLHILLLGLGICFHVGVYFLLDIGHFLSPWIWVYVFLVVGHRKNLTKSH